MARDGDTSGWIVLAAFAAVGAAAFLSPEPRGGAALIGAGAPPVSSATDSSTVAEADAVSPPDALNEAMASAWERERQQAIAEENEALRAAIGQLETANGRLDEENRSLRGHLSGVLNWVLDNFRGRYAVPEHLVGRMDVPSITDEFELHDDLADLLRMAPAERARINEAFLGARAMVEAAESEVMRASVLSSDSAMVEIPLYEERGEEVRRHLLAALDSALGTNRSPWAAAAARRDLERKFGDFGQSARTIYFEIVMAGDGKGPVARIHDRRERVLEDGRRQIESTELEAADIPDEYARFFSVLTAAEGAR